MPKTKKPDELVDLLDVIAKNIKYLGNGEFSIEGQDGAILHLSKTIAKSNNEIVKSLDHIADAITRLAEAMEASSDKM